MMCIATLVSLSLTPLHVDEIKGVHLHTHQVDVRGRAVLFASGAARLPDFVPENVALAALDVAGAGPQVSRLCARPAPGKEVRRLLVLGCGGKSGLIVAAAAGGRAAGRRGREPAARPPMPSRWACLIACSTSPTPPTPCAWPRR